MAASTATACDAIARKSSRNEAKTVCWASTRLPRLTGRSIVRPALPGHRKSIYGLSKKTFKTYKLNLTTKNTTGARRKAKTEKLQFTREKLPTVGDIDDRCS